MNQAHDTIEHNFYRLFLGLTYLNLYSDLREALGPKSMERVLTALRCPTPLTENEERSLDMMEDHMVFALQGHFAQYAVC